MSIILTILALIVALLISDVINRLLSRVSGSLIQIVMGVILALFANLQVHLDQEWFLLLFIAPLLFNDGKRFPKRELWELKRPIFENAILLVFITMFIGGFLLHWMIPGMPLAVSFALAAILSPTDPVAVQSIAKRSNLPSNILHLVSGESLINDASGLIGFKYAVAAAVSGQFFFTHAIEDFFYISIMGLILGVVLIYIISTLKSILYRVGIKGVAFHTVLQLVTPLVIYFVTEEFHASGVIAVVSGGIVYHLRSRTNNEFEPELALVTEKSWDIIIYVLNGIIFLLLGYSLPKATSGIIKDISWEALDPIFYAFMTWVILFTIRFLWITVYQLWNSKASLNRKNLRIGLLSAFSGVRGAITMVGVLSLPFVTNSGTPFPLRDLVLFIASFVIIWSLLAAIFFIPRLTGKSAVVDDEENEYYSEDLAYYHVIQNVIRELRGNVNSSNPACVNWVVWQYQILLHRLSSELDDDTETKRWIKNQFALQRIALDRQRKEVQRLYQSKQISRNIAITLYQKINQREAEDLSLNGRTDFWVRFRIDFNFFRRAFKAWIFNRRNDDQEIKNTRQAEIILYQASIEAIDHYMNRQDISNQDFDHDMVNHIRYHYRAEIQALQGRTNNMNRGYYNVQIKAFGMQRRSIQNMLEDNQIDWTTANHLRQKVNYLENVIMQNNDD